LIDTAFRTEIIALLKDARARTVALVSDLTDDQLSVPMLEIVNPYIWELGHVAYFAEFWTRRNLYGLAPIIANADQLYDSAKIPHDDRWSLPLPSRAGTMDFLRRQLEQVEEHLERGTPTDKDSTYFHRLALYHEDMHGEASIYTRQTLGYSKPQFAVAAPIGGVADYGSAGNGSASGDVRVKGGTYRIGAQPDDGFVFDNEKWAHDVEVKDFEIARTPVTNADFAGFIESGGYSTKRYWSDAGWAWRESAQAEHPLYWRPAAARLLEAETGLHELRPVALKWERRHFAEWQPLDDHQPVCHVNWFEAEAFCNWAGRRLPTETEWEVAATGGRRQRYPWGESPPDPNLANVDAWVADVVDVRAHPEGDSPVGCRQMIGNVWEWTSTTFGPYPGFSPDPYKEYSEPWFVTHMVLRGGAWSTRARLITTRWRNFYRPHRRDIITGFRTCKL
jgi:iron(II)-dependent oxidoreductase